jgi:signal transduction histidine kinase/PAS domain-containing protein/ActR/RegA family two-component response regulator
VAPPAPIPPDDAERVAALRRLRLLDTPPEPAFDRITRAVARMMDVPTALVTLVDAERQWFKSRVGLDAAETPRDVSFCAHVVARREPMVVLDTHKDTVFADHPAVTQPPRVRFYAGAPLITSDGYALGTLCAVDYAPRVQFSDSDRQRLIDLAGAVVDAIEARAVSSFLRAQTVLLQTTVDAVGDGICAFDANLKLVAGNRRFLTLLDLPDRLGRKGADFADLIRHLAERGEYGPGDAEAQVAERVAIARRWQPRQLERRFRNGRVIEIHSVPLPGGGMVNTYSDVTETRRRTEALEHQARLFHLMEQVAATANQAPNLDTALQRVVDEVCVYTGWPVGNALLREPGASELVATEHWHLAGDRYASFPEASRHIRFGMGEGTPGRVMASQRLEWISDARDYAAVRRGKIAQDLGLLSTFAFPVFARGEVRAVLQFYNDKVTPVDPAMFPVMDFATAQLSRVAEREEMARLKNEFVSTVSHELRTPLTSIAGALELIDAGVTGALPEKTHDMVRIAYQNSQRLIRLINDILDIEKIESGRMTFDIKRGPLRPLIERAISETEAFAAGFNVTLRLAPGVDAVAWVDPDRFLQVVTNLLSNAAKFSPSGGTVEVQLGRHGDRVRVSVADKGPGIPEEFRSRLFEKFAQADSSDRRAKGGTGLGLAIVKGIVEHLGGSISVDTALGVGTTFHIDLPEGGGERTVSPAAARPRILILEDDIASSALLEAICRDLACECDVAHSTVGARRLIAERPYSLLITDVMLPGQSGIDFLAELRAAAKTENLPVIVVSSEMTNSSYAEQASRLGIVEWVQKPVDARRLIDLVERIVVPQASQAR